MSSLVAEPSAPSYEMSTSASYASPPTHAPSLSLSGDDGLPTYEEAMVMMVLEQQQEEGGEQQQQQQADEGDAASAEQSTAASDSVQPTNAE